MKLKNKILAGLVVLRANFLGHKIPLSVSLRATFRCNLNCSYCVVGKIAKDMYEMTTDEIKHLINELKSLGTQSLSFAGGEPLLRKDMGEIINYCKEKGIATYMATNAKLLAERVNEVKNLDTLLISIDGRRGFHDSKRGQGSFDSVMKGIKAVKGANFKDLKVWLNMVITKDNKNQIDYVIDLAEKNGFLVNFNILMITCTTRDGTKLHELSDLEVKEIYKDLIAKKKAGKPIAYSLAMLEFYYKTGGLIDYSISSIKCWAGRLYCTIDPNGDVYPCSDLVGIIKPKNCLKLGFKKAFESLAPINCKGCTHTCYVQKNLLFSLDWNSLMYILKSF